MTVLLTKPFIIPEIDNPVIVHVSSVEGLKIGTILWHPTYGEYIVKDINGLYDLLKLQSTGRYGIPRTEAAPGGEFTVARPAVSGPKGDKGDKGDTGDRGDKGDKGDKGDTGLQGIAGKDGREGRPGIPGSRGHGGGGGTGPQGLQGLPGLPGLQGLQGIPGLQGIQGIQGIQGNPGPNQVTTTTTTNITGLLKGDGSTVSAATAGTDYLIDAPSDSTSYARQNAAWINTPTFGTTIIHSNAQTPLYIYGSEPGTFYQVNQKNTSNVAGSSTDWIATADNGNDTINYVDMGINGSGGGVAPFTAADDGYLYSASTNLNIGALGSGNKVNLFANGSVTPIAVVAQTGFTALIPVTAKSGAYTLTAADSFVTGTGTFTFLLPTAVGITGKVYTVKNIGTGVITLDGNASETIDGALTYLIRTTNNGVEIISDGANWLVKGVF